MATPRGGGSGAGSNNVQVWILGDSKSAQKAFEDFNKSAGKAETQLERTAGKVEGIGTRLGKIGAPFLLAAGASAKAAIDFESSFAGMRKTIDATEAEFTAFAAQNRQLAKEIPLSVNEINAIGEAAGQLGIQKENIQAFTRTMADLGVATNLTSEEAATAFARFANITQMPQDQFDRLGSTVVDLGNNLATTESEIAAFGLRLAGAGAQIGLTEAEILGLGGALSSVGINAEAGGTAVSKVMINMANAVSQGGEELDQFARTAGMSAEEFARAFREDPASAIVAFIEGLGRINESGGDLFATLEELGITEQRMRDAMLRTAGAGDLVASSMRLANEAFGENNALTNEAEQRYETMASQLTIAKNHLYDAGITIGQTFAPMIVQGAQAVAALTEAFAALPAPVSTGVIGLGVLLAAAKPASVAVAGVMRSWQALDKAFKSATAMRAAGTGIEAIGASAIASSRSLGVLAAVFSPAGVLVAGVAALAGGLYMLHRRNEQVRGSIDSTAEAAPKLAESVGLAYEEIAAAADDAREKMELSSQQFANANANAIRQLRELRSTAEREAFLLQVGWELVQHGASTDEAFEAIQQLADAAGITVPISLDADDLAEIDAYLESLGVTVERAVGRIADGVGGLNIIGADVKEELAGIAGAAADAFNLEDGVGDALRIMGEFEHAVRNSGAEVAVQDQLIRTANRSFLEQTGITGLSIRGVNDLRDANRELTSAVASTSQANRDAIGIYEASRRAGLDHEEALSYVDYALHQAAAAADENADATGNAGDAAAGAVDPTDDYAGSVEELGTELEDTRTAAERLGDALDSLAGINLDAAKTEIAFLDSLDKVNKSVKDNGTSLDRATQKGRDNQSALLSAIDAAQRHAEAVAEQTGSVDAGAAAFLGLIENIKDQAAEAGISREAVDKLVAALGLIPDEVAARVVADTSDALSAISEVQRRLNILGNSGRVYIGGASSTEFGVRHDGGWAGAGVADYGRKAAGRSGLRPGEVPIIALENEYVLSPSQSAAFANMGLIPRRHQGGPADHRPIAPLRGAASRFYDVPQLFSMTRTASFGSAGEHAESIEQLREAYERTTAAIEAQEQASRRAELVEQARLAKAEAAEARREVAAAKTAKARKSAQETAERAAEQAQRAAKAVDDFDHQATLTAQRRAIEERIAAAEANQRIKANLEQWAFENAAAEDQIEIIRRRIRVEREGSDEWLALKRQEQSLAQQIASDRKRDLEETQRLQQQAAAATKAYLDEEKRQRDQVEAETKRHLQALVDAHRQATEQMRQAVDARRDALSTAFGLDERPRERITTSAAGFQSAIRDQIEAYREWGQALEELRARGLDEGIIDQLGLDDSPQALDQIRRFLGESQADLDALNATYAERVRVIEQQIGREKTQTESDLGQQLATIRAEHHRSVQLLEEEHQAAMLAMAEEHQTRLDELRTAMLKAEQAMVEQLHDAGYQQGRALAQGQLDGLNSLAAQIQDARRRLLGGDGPEAGTSTSGGMKFIHAVVNARTVDMDEGDLARTLRQVELADA